MLVAQCWKACSSVHHDGVESNDEGTTDQDDTVSDLIAALLGYPLLHTPRLSAVYVCTISISWICVFYCMMLRVTIPKGKMNVTCWTFYVQEAEAAHSRMSSADPDSYIVSSFEQFAMLTYYCFISIVASIWSGFRLSSATLVSRVRYNYRKRKLKRIQVAVKDVINGREVEMPADQAFQKFLVPIVFCDCSRFHLFTLCFANGCSAKWNQTQASRTLSLECSRTSLS